MTSLAQLKELGEGMGLTGESLLDFVTKQQAAERDERAIEREVKKEREEKNRLLEMEKLRRDQKELEVRELEAGKKKPEKEVFSWDTSFDKKYQIKGPKMPPFEEGKDNMDSYIQRFERYAEVQQWHRREWAIFLSALLKGRALDVYSRLPPDKATDYDYLKDALLKRFQLTEDGFRLKFRSVKAELGETPSQFLARLESYLLRWMSLAKVETSFEGLRDLILREQYINTCPSYLAVILKELAPSTLDDLASLAEKYLEAHVHEVRSDKGFVEEESRSGFRQFGGSKQSPQQRTSGRRCFICGKENHISTNCFYKHKAGSLSANGFRSGPSDVEYRNREEAQMTSSVSGYGVFSGGEQQQRRAATSGSEVAQCLEHRGGAVVANEVQLVCGCKLPVVACTKHTREHSMPVADGLLGDTKVKVLRDTGCSAVVVKIDLVTQEQLTGEYTTCVLIDGTVRRVPIAVIDLATPYFTGKVRALCMKKPLYDVVVGNIPGAKQPSELKHEVISGTEAGNVTEAKDKEEAHAVETRQKSRAIKEAPLRVTSELEDNVSKEELIK